MIVSTYLTHVLCIALAIWSSY